MPKPKRSFAENLATIGKAIAGDAPSKPISSTTKTVLIACAAFVTVWAIFGPKPQPDRRVLYTGCELRGAIKRCDEFAKAVANGWHYSGIHSMPLPPIAGEPSTQDQIDALAWQDQWRADTISRERTEALVEHYEKVRRQDQERRGVKF